MSCILIFLSWNLDKTAKTLLLWHWQHIGNLGLTGPNVHRYIYRKYKMFKLSAKVSHLLYRKRVRKIFSICIIYTDCVTWNIFVLCTLYTVLTVSVTWLIRSSLPTFTCKQRRKSARLFYLTSNYMTSHRGTELIPICSTLEWDNYSKQLNPGMGRELLKSYVSQLTAEANLFPFSLLVLKKYSLALLRDENFLLRISGTRYQKIRLFILISKL